MATTLSPYCGIEGLAACAIGFAEERLTWGKKITAACDGSSKDRIRIKIAIRALEDSQRQLKAAIALLNCSVQP